MLRRTFVIVAALTVAAACAPAHSDSVTVFAASSLTEAFEALALDFESAHPGTTVRLNFAGSQSLRTQLLNGARADVFASANPKHMEAVKKAGLVSEPVTFATNSLVLAVPSDNPAELEAFADLVRAQKIVLAGEEVPAGAYANRVLSNARRALGDRFVEAVLAQVVSRENDVRSTLQKVALGEADAALVYLTDARAASLPAIDLPSELNVRATYPIAPVEGSRAGRAFTDFVSSAAGQARLREFGFGGANDGMSASRQ